MIEPVVDLPIQTDPPGNGASHRSGTPSGFAASGEAPDGTPIYDPVTGLPSRTLFLDRLGKAMAAARRDARMTGIMVLSFDRLDGGRRRGGTEDAEALKRIAAQLLGNLRATDSVARLGERTFGVIQFGLKRADDCFALCRRLQKLFADPNGSDEQGRERPTIGAAIADSDREPAALWLQRAETAMREGKPRECNFSDPVHEARWKDRLSGERQLWQALREEQFELHYLPLIRPSNRQIVGLEALLRWRHPTRGLLPPAVFLPLAEACGQMPDIGPWVLRRACADAVAWPSPLPQVMVNVSAAQFRHGDLIAEVAGALEASGLAADRLVLEINEDVLLDAPDQAVPVFNGLRARGIGIALDDFGTGRSSLNLLQSFTFDRIKIDQRLIAETTRDPGAATIARAIIAAGRAMGARITAEGVDSDQKLAFLMQAGCDEVQGFYFGRPLPNGGIRRMIELIDAHRSTPIWSSAAGAASEEVRA